MTQQQPILFTMRIKTANWDNLKRANDELFGALIERAREAGLISSKVYRSEEDPSEVLFVSEWRSHDDRTHSEASSVTGSTRSPARSRRIGKM
jgi:heme-degrading monooxygenase HmoA